MKKLSIIFSVFIILFSCKSELSKTNGNIEIGDTITTNSGLKYIYLKKGNGRKIEPNSKVKVFTDLYLKNVKSTIWKTSDSPDSLFTFIHQKTPLIKGFKEIHNYLVEGDEIIAILPDSLAYGKTGRGIIPPKATLIYKPLIVKHVSEPKVIIADTLLTIAKNNGGIKATEFYEKVLNSKNSNKYHLELSDLRSLTTGLEKDSLYIDLENVSHYFLSKTDDENLKQNFLYSLNRAYVGQGKIKEAISLVEPLTKKDVNKNYWINVLASLKKLLETK